MDEKRLRYFVAIYEGKSITQAATRNGVAQPALSQQLVQLERELDTRLFDRRSHGVVPTQAAHRLYHRAQAVLRQLDGLKAAISEPVSDTVAVGLPSTLALSIGLDLIRAVHAQQPEINLQIVEDWGESLAQQVLAGRLSFSIVSQRSAPALECTLVSVERMSCIAPRAWRLGDTISLAELGDVPMVLTCRPHTIRALVDAGFARAGLTPRIVAEIDSIALLHKAVVEGVGATVLPARVFTSDTVSTVQAVRLKDELYFTTLLCEPLARELTPSEKLVRRIILKLIAPELQTGDG